MTAASGRRFLPHRSSLEDCNDMNAHAVTAMGSGTTEDCRADAWPVVRRRSKAGRAWACGVAAVTLLAASGGVRAADVPSYGSVVVSEDGVESVPTGVVGQSDPAAWDSSEPVPAGGMPMAPAAAAFRPRWDLAVDALMLWQGNAQDLPLFLDSAGGTALNAQDLQTQMGAGARVGLMRYVDDSHAIEGNYFQARPFNATGTAAAAGGPYELTNTGDLVFNDIESATVSSSGWIQSAELNWRKCVCYSPISWIAGFRWVELNSQTNVDYAFTNPDPFGSGSIDTAAGNNLYGGQLGADMRLWNAGGRWRVNGIGKAGVFYNSASFQRSSAGFTYADGTPFPLGTVAATADQTAFFGEVGLNTTWWVTNWLAWRAGYTVMWASGVAVAAEQLPLNNFGDGTASIDTDGSVLLHGVTTGIEARW